MAIETWLAFVATSAVLLVIPGPTMPLVVYYALGRGWREAAPVEGGVALGDLTAMTLSMLGLGVVLAQSAKRVRRLAGSARAVRMMNRAGGSALTAFSARAA